MFITSFPRFSPGDLPRFQKGVGMSGAADDAVGHPRFLAGPADWPYIMTHMIHVWYIYLHLPNK